MRLAEMLARGIRGARLEVVEGAGHLSPMEHPQEFNHILNQFLERLPQGMPEPTTFAY